MKYTALDKTLEIIVPETYESIGIAMSGGLDSTLLAALLFPLLDVSKVTVYTINQGRGYERVGTILRALGVNPKHVLLPDPKLANGDIGRLIKETSGEVDYFYSGINTNPPWADEIPEGKKPRRLTWNQKDNRFFPFALLHKTHLIDLMVTQNLTHLLPLTYTCTESIDVPCKVCFACRERIWAFETYGLKDPV